MKFLKKALSLGLVGAMTLGIMAGCSNGGDKSKDVVSTVDAGSGEAYKVYLITMDQMDQHWVSVDEGAKAMAAALGSEIDYQWDAPDTKDNAKQIEKINNAVANGADLILLAANDPTAISDAIKNAKDKGVKIIYVDSGAKEEAITTLSTDNYNAGYTAGKTMLESIKNTSGSIGVIGVNTATNSTMSREDGFRKAIEDDGRFTLLTTEYKDGDAAASQEAALSFITAKNDLVGLYGTNEGSTTGVGNAIKASGKEIIGVGFDKSDSITGLLEDGSLVATMAQNPYTMGYLGMAQAYAALKDLQTGPAIIDTGVSVLEAEK